jgi:flavin reductase (DIM6/NTAB) family NADH-FMN oxidoreductase RutF
MATNAQSQNPISEALRKITYGYYILTTRKSAEQLSTRDQDYIAAGTVCWVTQVSFEPHMVMVAVGEDQRPQRDDPEKPGVCPQRAGPQNQPLIEKFSRKTNVEEEAHQLNDYAFEDGKTGSPLLTDTVASFECNLVEVIHSKADHVLLLGEVVEAIIRNADEPLLTDQDAGYKYGG